MSVISLMTREIPHSGIGYLRCESYDAADFSERLTETMQTARAHGATYLHFGSQDDAFAQKEHFTCAGQRFDWYSDFNILLKKLTAEDGAVLRTKPLRVDHTPLYEALYNEVFAEVPNAMTMDADELKRIQNAPFEAGFFMRGGEPLGFYELDFSDATPEIAAVGLRQEYRHQGYGVQMMRTLENLLISRGYTQVQLLVASANKKACALYEARGFERVRRMSRWFRTELK